MKTRNVFTTAAIMAFTGVASAEPFVGDYNEATSAYEDAYISGSFNLNSGNQDQTSHQLDLSIDYEKVFSSPDKNIKLDALGFGSNSKAATAGSKSNSTYNANASATMDKYFQPGSKGGFWYGKAAVGVQKDQVDPFSSLTAGVGYGRVVNVTPMARAIRIMQELRKRGAVKGDPSNAVYQSVAEIISRENEYKSKFGYQDYAQNWVEDIEKVLSTNGVLTKAGGMSAGSVIKAYDVLEYEPISTRKKGWLVRAGVGAVLSDYDGSDGKPVLEVGAEYHKPLSNQTQFSNEAIMSGKLKNAENAYNFNNSMSLTHEITDRIDWRNAWLLDYNKYDTGPDVTTNVLQSQFIYDLRNQLYFDITGRLTKFDDSVDDAVNGLRNDEIDKSLTMGVTYRLK